MFVERSSRHQETHAKKHILLVSPLSTISWNCLGPRFWIPTKGILSDPKVDWPCQDFNQGSTYSPHTSQNCSFSCNCHQNTNSYIWAEDVEEFAGSIQASWKKQMDKMPIYGNNLRDEPQTPYIYSISFCIHNCKMVIIAFNNATLSFNILLIYVWSFMSSLNKSSHVGISA